MLRVNENYSRIQASYLFTEIAHRVAAHQQANPEAKVIRLGIGDVTEPLCPAVVAAMHRSSPRASAGFSRLAASFCPAAPPAGRAFPCEAFSGGTGLWQRLQTFA